MDETSLYLEEHRFVNQRLVDGFPINPKLRAGFDDTPNDDRDDLEVEDWWGKPFIITQDWDDHYVTWEDYTAQGDRLGFERTPKDIYEKDKAAEKLEWLENFPSGVRYEIRCLDGGAWDRSTLCGITDSLDKALEIARKRVGK